MFVVNLKICNLTSREKFLLDKIRREQKTFGDISISHIIVRVLEVSLIIILESKKIGNFFFYVKLFNLTIPQVIEDEEKEEREELLKKLEEERRKMEVLEEVDNYYYSYLFY